MGETVYINRSSEGDGPIGIIFTQATKVIDTGISILSERNSDLVSEVSRLCGMTFFLDGQVPEVPLYAVPYLEVFASDGRDGWFAATSEGGDGPLYHIDRSRSVRLLSDCYREFFNEMLSNPDWRQMYLPGGPWPRLPEDAGGRRELTEKLGASVPSPREAAEPGPLPRVFRSREEAEREFPIQDLWTVLRQKREPRFQVWAMMSPADRAGKAHVHYTAWQETYTGIMDPRVLAWNTPERCREAAEKYPQDTLVLLDRAQEDRVAGFACWRYNARPFISVPEAGEITALYILKEYQGLGLGRMLMERCLACIPRPRTALLVLRGNEKAIGFYEHMGFRLTGRERTDAINGGEIAELEMVMERTK